MLAVVLAMMLSLAPNRDHSELARAVASVVAASDPLFVDDTDKRKTAALATAVLFREGSLGTRVEGDFRNGVPTSWCSAQINLSPGAKTREGWTGPELRDDPVKCVTVEMRMLRESMRVCSRYPVAHYAEGGVGACTSVRAQRISNDRLALARRLVQASVKP